MDIIAIDPGTTESAWIILDTQARQINSFGIAQNPELCAALADKTRPRPAHFVIEKIASYGMAVGEAVFETCVWSGHFISAFTDNRPGQLATLATYTRITRHDVKMTLCKRSSGINDAVIRQRLIDLWGPRGTKKNPGPTYGISTDVWAALAVGTAWMLQRRTPGTEAWQG